MDETLKAETEKLTRMWMRHDAAWLREYLVSGVEDPRLNLQSILCRHALTRALFPEKFGELMHEELRFGAVMDWLTRVSVLSESPEEAGVILHALRHGADNAEGLSIPRFVVRTFADLPADVGTFSVPNYLEAFLKQTEAGANSLEQSPPLDSFAQLWNRALSKMRPTSRPLTVLEPACGSANEYRFFKTYGLAQFLNYSGFDLCEKNVANARVLAPDVPFSVGNVFEIAAPDQAFDWCIVHDLFEHLSLAGMRTAISEVCRVCRTGICVAFFQMDEFPEHRVRPLADYFCNRLSMQQTKQAFAEHSFTGQTIHLETFLRLQSGWEDTHNPFAYTFVLKRSSDREGGRS